MTIQEVTLEKRRLGRINHMSSVVIYGAASLGGVTQDEADASIEYALSVGINHFDTAASYGEAELRLGPWMSKIRKDIFLATKTEERSKDAARRQIEKSLQRLQVDQIDLIQIHAITTYEELDQITAKGGALEAAIEAKEEGLVKHIGITGHGHIAPAVHLEGLKRYPFETVITPLNFVLYNNLAYRSLFNRLVEEVKRQDAGLMVIKAVSKGEWKTDQDHTYTTWYEPFDEQEHINQCVNFVLSNKDIVGLASAGDIRLLPKIVNTALNHQPLSPAEQEQLMSTAGAFSSPFGPF